MHFNSVNRAATVLWDHTFSSTLVNEGRINASGWQEKDQGSALNPQAPFGLPSIGITAPGSSGLSGSALATEITSTSGRMQARTFSQKFTARTL